MWRLADLEPPALEMSWRPHGSSDAEWVEWVSARQLVTWARGGSLKSWIPPRQSEAYHLACAVPPVLTPGNRYLVVPGTQYVHFVDVITGQPRGSIRIGFDTPKHASVSPDGRKLAVTVPTTSSTWKVSCFDLQSRQKLFESPLPPLFVGAVIDRPFRWLGDDYLLCGAYLLSIQGQEVVWHFNRLPKPISIPDDRFWNAAKYNSETVLAPLVLPDDELQARLVASGRFNRLLKAGDHVSVDLRMAAPCPKGFETQLAESVRLKLAECGLNVSAASERTVTVTINDIADGGTTPFAEVVQARTKYAGSAPERVKKVVDVPNKTLKCIVKIAKQGGEPIWQKQFSVSTSQIPTSSIGIFESVDAEWFLSKRWNKLRDDMNRYLKFQAELWNFDGLGESELSNSFSREWLAEQAIINSEQAASRHAEQQAKWEAERERSRPKIDLPWPIPPKPTWSATPDPLPPSEGKLFTRPFPIAQGDVKGVKFSSSVHGQAIVQIEESDEARVYVRRYNLRDKQLVARTEISFGARLCDFRLDGKVWLLSPNPDAGSLQVWQCGPDEDHQVAEFEVESDTPIEAAQFIGRNRIAAFNRTELVLLELPSGNEVYRRSLRGKSREFSCSRKYFVDSDQGRIGLYNTLDGSLVGRLEKLSIGVGPSRASRVHESSIVSVAFHPDGETLAILLETNDYSQRHVIGIWDLRSGSSLKWFPASSVSSSDKLRWTGPNYLLVGDDLFDASLGAMVWGYHSLTPDSPDGRGWYICEDKGVKHLASIAMPSEFVLDAISDIATRHPPMLRPGEAVSLEAKASLDGDDSQRLLNAMQAVFTKKLANNEIEVRPGERKVFRLTLQPDSNTRDPYRIVVEGNELIVPNKSLRIQVELVVDRRKVWETVVATELSEIDYEPNMLKSDPAADLIRQQEAALLDQLEQLDGQALSYPALGYRGFGSSYHSIKGERLSVDSRYRF